jgi:hypothetical protein
MVVKFVVTTALIALLSFVVGLFLPWWTIALAAFAVSALIPQRPIPAFFSGFAALFCLWGLLALVADLRNESILSARVAAVLPLGGSSIAILLVTAFVGALVGGGGSLTAAFLRK